MKKVGCSLKRALPWIALCGVLFLIFGFSSQSGETSQGISQPIAVLLSALVPGFDGMDGAVQQQVLHALNLLVRKGAHTAEYTLLAACAFWAFGDFPPLRGSTKRAWMRRFAVVMGFVLMVGMIDEFNQTFSGGRSGLMIDAVYDFVTSGIVMAAALLIAWKRKARRS